MRPYLPYREQEEHQRRRHYGSPYAPGPRYWRQESERYDLPFEPLDSEPYGSPYAKGPQYTRAQIELDWERGLNRYGSPYAPGPDYTWRRNPPYNLEPEGYGSPYAPGPGFTPGEWESRGSRFDSPYAPAPGYAPYEVDQEVRFKRLPYGASYAPGLGYTRKRPEFLYGMIGEGYGSLYAPGPEYPQRGPHYGRGPRNYRRPDERLLEEVCDLLTIHGGIDARDIEVFAEEGEIRLEGTVQNQWAKRAAEDTALNVLGVIEVHNHLRVHHERRANLFSPRFRTESGHFKEGMPVLGREGDLIGTIQEIRSYDFRVARAGQPDVYVPFGAALAVNGGVLLDIPAHAVDQQQWPEA